MRRVKRFWRVALIGGAAALVFAVVAPVFGSTPVNADHLRLLDDAELFFYGDDNPDGAGLVVEEQYLTVGSNTCEFTTSGASLVSVTSNVNGNIKDPGLFDQGMGVKSKGANGTPCAETSDPEKLKITAADGQKWIRLRLDTQPKQNAWVIVDLYDGDGHVGHHELLTGGAIAEYNSGVGAPLQEVILDNVLPYEAYTGVDDPRFPAGTDLNNIEACANPSDSGPDSGINDNCIWHIVNSSPFTRVEITTLKDLDDHVWGSVALEGGDDYAGWDPVVNGMDGASWDSLFYRALGLTDDSYSVDEDQILNVAADGVLANDSVPPGTVTLTVIDDVDNGTLSLSNDGSFTYTPDPNYNGLDGFTYQASVGGETATADVAITVNPVNDPPTGDDGPVLPPVDEDDPATAYGAEDLASDIDIGDELTITSISAENGTATITDGGSSFTYEPDPDFCGIDTITFTVEDQDGASTGIETITIEVVCVNDSPVAADDSYELNERAAPTFSIAATFSVPASGDPDLLDNDTDVDLPGDAVDQGFLDVTANTEPSHPVLALSGDLLVVNADGSFSYTPDLLDETDQGTPGVVDSWEELGAFSYTVTWDYTVSDGLLTDTGTVTMTIHRVICSEETVYDTDGDVTGGFTLLQPVNDPPKCKPYSVVANSSANAIDFVPEGDGGDLELFRGLLSFSPEPETQGGSEYTLTLVYDPFFDPEFPLVVNYIDVPQCIDPVYELGTIVGFPGVPPGFQTMLVVDADFGALPMIDGTQIRHSWCWAGDISIPDGQGGVISIRQVIGEQDPRFGGGI